MKQFIILFASLLPVCLYSQDTIILMNKTTIYANVVEINDEQVKYKLSANPDGPLYIKDKDDIVRIKYQNGNVDDFTEDPAHEEVESYDMILLYTATKRGNKVYIESDVPNAEIHAKNCLLDWGYWKITENSKDADFRLKFILVKYWPEYFGLAQFIDPQTNKVIYQTKKVSSEWNMDFNSKRGVVEKLIRRRIQSLYPD